MRYGSVCSGIEAASCAWEPLGWEPAWFAEIEPFPSAVLAHHYPNVKNLGDFTQIGEEYGPIDLLVGGTPCQAFSVAGARKGLDDPRGNLTIEFARLAARLRPAWLVWENVPGVLSIDGGRTFGTFLGMLGELGYGFAYRVLDAQYFGVPQRRRRVFVVGYLGDWRRAAAVLFECESMSGHPAPRREKRQSITPGTQRGFAAGGFGGYTEGAGTLRGNSGDLSQGGSETLVARSTGAGWYTQDGTASVRAEQGGTTFDLAYGANNQGLRAVSTALSAKNQRLEGDTETFVLEPTAIDITNLSVQGAVTGTLEAAQSKGNKGQFIAFHENKGGNLAGAEHERVLRSGASHNYQFLASVRTANTSSNGWGVNEETAYTLDGAQGQAVAFPMTVRRLTPGECESLQGFPRGWTDVRFRGKPAADGPRYRAIGNSMAVPVMRWIGQRIEQVDSIERKESNHAT